LIGRSLPLIICGRNASGSDKAATVEEHKIESSFCMGLHPLQKMGVSKRNSTITKTSYKERELGFIVSVESPQGETACHVAHSKLRA